jgi:hypothetical protein
MAETLLGAGEVTGVSMDRRAGLVFFDLVGADALTRRVQIEMSQDPIWIHILNQFGETVIEGSLDAVSFRVKGFLRRQATEALITVHDWDTDRKQVFVFSENDPALFVKLFLQD